VKQVNNLSDKRDKREERKKKGDDVGSEPSHTSRKKVTPIGSSMSNQSKFPIKEKQKSKPKKREKIEELSDESDSIVVEGMHARKTSHTVRQMVKGS
jgi:hypothetical protein